ncbi:MAG: DUF6600 domain-containing protein [Terriglobia bacterium]
MKPAAHLVKRAVGFLLFSAFATLMAWGEELSHVRIVRLSFTEGTVTVQRADVEEWATAPANTPIQEGFKVATAENSFAEAEFENSSTARIGQLSLLEFTQLALLPSGGKVNRLTLKEGYATFNFIPEGDDFYEVAVGEATLRPQGKSRFRVDFDQGMLQVKVFSGSVEVASGEGNGTLGKNTVLEIRPGEPEPFQISQGITKDAWDEWVEERENRVAMARNQGAPVPYSNNVSDLLYGFSDLTMYGDWVSVPGYGYGWTPYADTGWSPFTVGRWCWYPGFGYTWISGEPWGWLPYHYGSWVYVAGMGWAWIPGSFTSWSPAVVHWYRGPGWVGWAPMSPRLGGGPSAGGPPGPNHCPQPRGCITTVHEDTLRNGWHVVPNRRDDIDPRRGRIVDQPDVAPERTARLTGEPSVDGAGFRRGPIWNRDGVATGRTIPARPSSGSTSGATSGSSSIVYDPAQRQYVNNPRVRSVPAPTREASAGAAPAAVTRGGRPGPVTNYPVPAGSGPNVDQPGVGTRNEPRVTRSPWSDDDDPGASRTSGQAVRGGASRPADRNTSADSPDRVAPRTVVRPEAGSRSASDRGSSSGGSRIGSIDRGGSSSRGEGSGGRSSASSSGGSSSRGSGGSSSNSGGWSGGGGSSRGSGGGSSSSGGWSGGGGGSSHSSGSGGSGGTHNSGGGGNSSGSGGGSHSSSPRR